MAAVPFALTQPLSGIWKVYAAASGDALAPGVTASSLGSTLTLSHGSDVPWGTYYVSLTEPDKPESLRAALTVVGEYSITYHLNGMDGPADTVYQANTLPYTLPVLSAADKVFMGWYGNESFTGSEITEIPAGTLGPVSYWAWWVDPPPPIDVGSPGSSGPRWSFSNRVITLQNGANVTLTGSTTSNRVVVEPGASVMVKLSNVSIIRSANGSSAYTAFSGYNAAVTLLLEGENTVAVNEYYTRGDYAFNVTNLTIDSAASANAGTDASSRSTLGTLNARGGGNNQEGSLASGRDPGAAFGGGDITLLGGVVIGESSYDHYRAVYSGGNFILKGGVFIASQIIHAEFSRPALSTGIVFAGGWINRYNFDWRGYDGMGYDISVALPNTAGDVIITGDEVTVEAGSAKTITLNAGLAIPAGATLRVPYGWTLKLNGHTLAIADGGTVLCSDWPGGSVVGDLTPESGSGTITD
jgi:hypothetical protein